MKLFSKDRKGKEGNFDSLADIIDQAKNDEELVKLAEQWVPDIDNCSVEYWTDRIYGDDINKLDINKLPIVLDVFYKTTDKFKFMLFCMILESTIEDLPYLTNLENVPLFEAKWEIFKHTLITIIKYTNSALIDCMYLILINNDPEGKYLSPDEKQDIIDGTNKNLSAMFDYINTHKELDPSIYRSLEVCLDAACYINNNETTTIINKISKLYIDNEALMFLVKYELANGNATDPDHIEKILSEQTLRYRFFRILEALDKLNILNGTITQDNIALSRMTDWLIYPTELGKLPNDIQIVSTFEQDNLIYYIFRFTTDLDSLKDRGYMIGVVGGYQKGDLSASDSGIVFSEFESIREDYEAQAI